MQLAFMSILLLLLFSGTISLFELERVSHDTEVILHASKESTDLAGEMISALNDQNDAMISMAVISGSLKDIAPHLSKCEESIERLTAAAEQAHQRMIDTDHAHVTDSLVVYTARINDLAQSYINGDIHRAIAQDTIIRTTTHSWYVEQYKPQYTTVSTQITKYMTGSETTLGPDVNRLSHTARRAVTPVFISLVVMFVAMLMLYYFLHVYFIRPILRINRNLGDYLSFRMPFEKDASCRDEIATLRERIIALIERIR
jgi:methyl-accepting chemotaxis protein